VAIARNVPNERAEKVELLPGLLLWREVTAYADDYKGFDVAVHVVLDDGRLTAYEVKVKQRPGGPAVTGEALRQVKVAAFVRNSIAANSTLPEREPGETYTVAAFGLLEPSDVARMREAGPVTETLEWVAKVYTVALATGDQPTKAVRNVFEIAQSTAGQWVKRARDKRLLGPAEPGKAG
jgi:hypothetical protein